LEAVGFVDSLYFGAWNYSALTKKFPDRAGFYEACTAKVKRFCREKGIEYSGAAT
jgi:hypothetical protein